MNDAGADAPPRLRWPDGLDEAGFLARHWQCAPLLLRQALPGFETPLPPDELAGLSLEPDTTPRLVRERADGSFALEHGPFDEETFATLGERGWSLLVTDVEKHLPELAVWLAAFRLAPDWRLDDLMVSYAPDGASVGAHTDEYDVFLLQASGTRRWSIDSSAKAPSATAAPATAAPEAEDAAHGDLRLRTDFTPTDTWDLEPGDVLYLPPGVPHHGVAVGDGCTTWSIGFRAPSAADVVLHVAERVAERLASRLPQTRLRDAGGGRGAPGEIDDAAIDAVAALWREATALDRDAFLTLAGELLTRSGTSADIDHVVEDDPDGGSQGTPAGATPADAVGHCATPFARLAWTGREARVRLFANGESLLCSRDLARRLCAGTRLDAETIEALDSVDGAVLVTLLERDVLVLDEDR